ncbi:MAG: bifunctional riboflavin kinase/FAD synthetase [Anaerolineales bacterium]|nr:bifunctional riboflavin kinase/FAD synthetase [Anaerolineales bacterium]
MAQHSRSLESIFQQNSWVTIGTFDGVHLGHQEILRGITAGAHAVGAPAVAITFHPHPKVVLRGQQGPFYLTTPEERVALIGEMGVDLVVVYPFTHDVSAMSARGFVELIRKHLGLVKLWVGYDFALGRNREGNVAMLQSLGEELGYQVHQVAPFQLEGRVVSSSLVRQMVAEGEVDTVQHYLGRFYALSGQVVAGDGRGRMIGIPTANLAVAEEKLCPGGGVYACRAVVDGQSYAAAANIGTRPTFDGKSLVKQVEAHLLDFHGDLYGKEMQLEFARRLRGERCFESVQELVAQIQRDIEQTREVVAAHS